MASTINLELAKKQGLKRTQILNIQTLQHERDNVEQEMHNLGISKETKKDYKNLLLRWFDINYVLQDIWRFELNVDKHQTWLLPNCKCPKLDNSDFGEHYYSTKGCPNCELINELKESEKSFFLRMTNDTKEHKKSSNTSSIKPKTKK